MSWMRLVRLVRLVSSLWSKRASNWNHCIKEAEDEKARGVAVVTRL